MPVLCAIPWAANDAACWGALDKFDIVAERNHDVAQANANAARNERGASNAFIQAGKNQQQITQFYLDELQAEEQAHMLDNALHKTLLVLAMIGLAL